jgi:sensor histidine kinase regulating citrate/malate metabolism
LTETYTGTLGPSLRAVVPVREDGRVVGLVAVGVLREEIAALVNRQLPGLLALALVALGVGAAGSLLLAARLRRHTLGLEPEEITALYQHRHATLHAIREGVLVLDLDGRVMLVNDEARRLLDLPAGAEGERLELALPAGPLRASLTDGESTRDAIHLLGERVLVVNQSVATVDGRAVGSVVTLRDRTELEALVRELDLVRGMADSLRAQAHESANRLHTLVGLVELGRHDEAVAFATEQVELVQELLGRLQEQIDDPALVALLLGKTAVGHERGIEVEVAGEAFRTVGRLPASELVTIVGNLVDNAMEAVAGAEGTGWVEVTLWTADGDALVEVSDSGPGIPADLLGRVFEPGVTTKSAPARERGLGLALVRHAAARLGGSVEARNDGGAVLTVRLTLGVREPVGGPLP